MSKEIRDSFVFYRSFFKAFQRLEDSDLRSFMDSMCDYALDEIPIKYEGLSQRVAIALELIEPQLHANRQRYLNGCKGGAPKGNKNAMKQLKTTKNKHKQPNDNDNVNPNVNENVNENDNHNDPDGLVCALKNPPSLAEITAYAETRNRTDLAQPFYDFFTAGNWYDSKGNPVKNWKQKFITWEKHNFKNKETNGNEKNNNPQEGQQDKTRRGNERVFR